jgi:hypothetical protein
VKDNAASFYTNGIIATGVVTGNLAVRDTAGLIANAGSTVIGNTAISNAREGISVVCPSNVTDNTAINSGGNLSFLGDGCSNTNNVAPGT